MVAISKTGEDNIKKEENTSKEGDSMKEQASKDKKILEPTLFVIRMGRTPTIVEIEIMGHQLTNTIVDGECGMNVLLEKTWRALGKPTLWPPTFHLVGVDQLM